MNKLKPPRQLISMLPTLVEMLGIETERPLEGRSALAAAAPERPEKIVYSDDGAKHTFDSRLEARWRSLERMLALFGGTNGELSLLDFPDPEETEIRVFILSQDGRASESNYPPPGDTENWHFRRRRFLTADPHNSKSLTNGARRLLTMNSRPLVMVRSHRRLLRALILRIRFVFTNTLR